VTAVAEEQTKKAKKKADEDPELPPAKAGEPGYDWSVQYPGEKVFSWTADDGTIVGLAAISEKRQPSIGFMRETRRKPDFEQTLDMVEFVASDDALAIIDGWTATQLVEMWNKWTEWNKTNAGK
jgi:hypothetical protein